MHKWYGDKVLSKWENEMNKRLKRAAIFLKGQIQKNISTGAPPHSAPGEFPHVVTGELRRSIAWTVDDSRHFARVGTNKRYAAYLTKGTRYMAPREFLERTLKENKGVIARLLVGKPL